MTASAPPLTQSVYLVDALKRVLKECGLTYADVASALGISHASVRRTFAISWPSNE